MAKEHNPSGSEHNYSNLQRGIATLGIAVSAMSFLGGCASEEAAGMPDNRASGATSVVEDAVQSGKTKSKTIELTPQSPPEEKEVGKTIEPFYTWNMGEEDVRLLVVEFDKLNPEEQDQAAQDWISRQVEANPELGVYRPEILRGQLYKENIPRIAETTSTMLNTLVAFSADEGNKAQMDEIGLIESGSKPDDPKSLKFVLAKKRLIRNVIKSQVSPFAKNRGDVIDKITLSVTGRFVGTSLMIESGEFTKDLTTDHLTIINVQQPEIYPIETTNGRELVYDIRGDLKGNKKMIEGMYMTDVHDSQQYVSITFNHGGKIFDFKGAGSDPYQP